MRKERERIMTDKLTQEDWYKLASLDLKPVHKAVVEVFKKRRNRPISTYDVWREISSKTGTGQTWVDLQSVSNALRTRDVPYRIRGFTKARGNPRLNLVRIVKVTRMAYGIP